MKISVNQFLLSTLVLATLCGCGIKPGSVSAPQGEEKDQFPHAYPHPSTFPDTSSK